MAEGAPPSGSAIPVDEVTAAVAQFRARFPPEDQLDQRMRILLALFQRVVDHARFGVPALLADQGGLDAFAFEAWVAYTGKHAKGQMNRPRAEAIRTLGAYWGRELEAGRSGTDGTPLVRDARFAFVRHKSGFEINERVTSQQVRLYVRWSAPPSHPRRRTAEREQPDDIWLAVSAERADAPAGPLPEDPRVVLPPSSPEQLLRDNAHALVTAFHAAQRSDFDYEERGVRVYARAQRGRNRRAGWSLFAVLVFAGCGIAYQRDVAAGRQVYYQMVRLLGANAYCDGPQRAQSAIIVNWSPPAPSGWFTRTYITRNGKRLARVDGLDVYRDRTVEPGRRYSYSFELRDLFGRLLVRDDTVSGDVALPCPAGTPSATNPITVWPIEGSFETPFTFTIRTPPVDGRPVRYAWSWKATRLDAEKRIVAPPPRITREPSTVIVFDPCTCGPAGTTSAGTRKWTCRVRTTVTFANDDVIEYGSPEVVILDSSGRNCKSLEDLARSDVVP
jgi:hypothetical protein